MKKLLTLVLLLCCLSMVLTMVACQDPTTPPEEQFPPNGSTDGTPMQWLNEDGSFRYNIVRGETADKNAREALIELRAAFAEATSKNLTEIPVDEDWVERDITDETVATWYEILIGNTKRPESQQVKATITGRFDYKIEVVGNKIVIVGYDDFVTLRATQYFINTYLSTPGTLPELSDTLAISGTYEPLPLEVTLTDKSNGKTNPRVVESSYPSEDVIIADIIPTADGYAVSNTGYGDSTAGIQKALDDCARNGGGTVYLPAGDYIITGKLVIPAYVTLRGDWNDPDKTTDYGTVLHLHIPSEDDNLSGTITLGGSGGVVGLTVYYPEQSLDAVKPYPFAFYTNGQGDRYMLSTVKNVTVLNGYRGIGACTQASGAHEQLTVENFKGTFLCCGTEIYNQADVGTWQDVNISGKYWKEATGKSIVKADAAKLDTYLKANTIGLILGDLEWTEFQTLKVDGCKIGIQIVLGRRIQFAGSLVDVQVTNCTIGLQVDDLDPRWGMVIACSKIEGGIINNAWKVIDDAGTKAQGMIKLCNVEVKGEIVGNVRTDATSDLSGITVDYLRTYQKPLEKLYVVTDINKYGTEDVTAAVQAVLDEAAATGGVVYLPAGKYRFDGKLTVPAGVELRGASSVANRDSSTSGTILLCYYGDGSSYNENSTAFITLAGDYAGVNGLRIIYPENGPYDRNLNTSYTIRARAKGVYVVNSCIVASAYGVDFRECDDHFIKKVTTCCYYNTFRLGGKNGMLSGCLQNGTVITRSPVSTSETWLREELKIWSDLFDPILRQRNLYIVLDGAEDQQIYNTFVYGCATMITCNNSTAQVTNIGSDNIGGSTAQLVMNSGKMVVVNAMRYNGHSYDHNGGTLEMYNRIYITENYKDQKEDTYIQTK